MNTVPLDRLKEVLSYDPDTGLFTWRVSLNARGPVGAIAGTLRPDGYVKIQIDGIPMMAHRLAWIFVHGYLPHVELDHINRVRRDNRLVNLRLATSKQNKENQATRVTNTSGHKGVHWDKSRGKWLAFVVHNRKFKNLGRYDDLNEAVTVAEDARRQLFTHHVVN